MSDEKLYEAVLRETFNNIRILLSSDKSIGKSTFWFKISPLEGNHLMSTEFVLFLTQVVPLFRALAGLENE